MANPNAARDGKLGGRPKSNATIQAQIAREETVLFIKQHLGKILTTLVKKAVKGDTLAIKECLDRGLGKSVQAIVTEDEHGERRPITITFDNTYATDRMAKESSK
jgi:hypothetical protein